jgi:hypothetical protein
MFLFRSENWREPPCNPLDIRIVSGGWGMAKIEDVSFLLKAVGRHFLVGFEVPFSAKIRVECHPSRPAPQVECLNRSRNEHVVLVQGQDFFWWAYEFAHELCHIVIGYDNFYASESKWFQESLCELASIFTLRRMSIYWRELASAPDLQEFAARLPKLTREFLDRPQFQLADFLTLPEWFQVNEQSLRLHPTYSPQANGVVAGQLLPLVEDHPEYWQSICFVPDSGARFEEFLREWHDLCPEPRKVFVFEILRLFGFAPGK